MFWSRTTYRFSLQRETAGYSEKMTIEVQIYGKRGARVPDSVS
jgi:hypothetical protein